MWRKGGKVALKVSGKLWWKGIDQTDGKEGRKERKKISLDMDE
jgi:hypothetical protein